MEIRRFGPGHRRPEGPAGTRGLTGQVIWSDRRANVSELAFSRHALVPPHENPNTTLFIVVSGGGFVQVGDERVRVNHGEGVVWPPHVPHGAYTDGSEMRAILVELTEEPIELDGLLPGGVLEGTATELTNEVTAPASGDARTAQPARGQLAERPPSRGTHDETEGEPW